MTNFLVFGVMLSNHAQTPHFLPSPRHPLRGHDVSR
jgi:hypothetical protein